MKVLLVACFALLTVASGFPTVSQWTLQELSEAIQNPDTNPLVLPFLEAALNDMMFAIWHGTDQNVATVVLPAAVVDAINGGDLPPIVDVSPVMPVLPVVPEAPVQEQTKSSPLVQIILNINQASSPVGPVSPVVLPEMIETPVVDPVGVITLPDIITAPEVVGVVDAPEFVNVVDIPELVVVAPPLNPIDEVAVEPMPVNPIDQVAIEALPINPIDILHPIGVVGGSAGGILV